jgi:hypothetical protein
MESRSDTLCAACRDERRRSPSEPPVHDCNERDHHESLALADVDPLA